MTLDLRRWREQYVTAARENQTSTLHSLASQLGTYLRDYRSGNFKRRASVEGSASWQELCQLAQNEQDPETLMALVTRINELLEERERSGRK